MTRPFLPTGEKPGAKWTVTPPADAAPGTYELTLAGRYEARDVE